MFLGANNATMLEPQLFVKSTEFIVFGFHK